MKKRSSWKSLDYRNLYHISGMNVTGGVSILNLKQLIMSKFLTIGRGLFLLLIYLLTFIDYWALYYVKFILLIVIIYTSKDKIYS